MQPTAQETIKAVTGPAVLTAAGILFLIDYAGGLTARQTWPAILILLGLSLAFQSLFDGSRAARRRDVSPPRRRKSLFGPILLIAAGALLLAANLVPTVPLRSWFANYWPWILVLWGGFRLLEVLIARLLGRSLPRGLGVGAVSAAFLLILAGSAARAPHPRHWEINLGGKGPLDLLLDTYEFPIDRSEPPPHDGAIVLQNLRGRVRVTGVEGRQFRIKGVKKIRAADRRAAQELDRRAQLKVSRQGEETLVSGPWIGDQSQRVSFDLEVETPKEVSLETKDRLEEISIEGISKSVSVGAGPRAVRLSRIGGTVRVRADHSRRIEGEDLAAGFELRGDTAAVELSRVAGPVDIRGNLFGTIRLVELQAPAEIRSRHGDLRLASLPGDLEVKMRSVSGSDLRGPLYLRGERWRRVRLEGVDGDLEIRGERMDVALSVAQSFGDIEVTVKRGDIELRLPTGAKFALDAATERGTLRHPFGAALQVEKRGPGMSLHGTVGEGPHVTLQTARGDIVLRRSSDGKPGDDAAVTQVRCASATPGGNRFRQAGVAMPLPKRAFELLGL